jgi:predicted DNA-binding transcriptional regulator AlpA
MLQERCRFGLHNHVSRSEWHLCCSLTVKNLINAGSVEISKISTTVNMSNKEKKKEFVAAGAPDFAMLNVKELEAFLKIDQKTIYRYVSLGLIPYVRIQSNIRFVKQQIVGWIEEQNFRPNPQISTNQTKR